MAKARFESYVEERVKELASAKRAKLKAAYDAEVAKVDRQCDKYLKAVEDGVEALVSKVVAQAKRDGCAVGGPEDAKKAVEAVSTCAKDRIRGLVGPRAEYDYKAGGYRWPEGTPVRGAQDALEAFDKLCAREARRLVVYKMDLGMKPEAFEKMLAEAAGKINRE